MVIPSEAVKTVSYDEMEAIVDGKMRAEEDKMYWPHIEWEVPLRSRVAYFPDDVIPVLEQLGTPDDVRLVFWFDN